MPTVADTIAKTRSRLLSGVSEQRNRLIAPYTAGSGTLSFEFPMTAISAGTRLSVGQTVFHVYSVNVGAMTAAVQAGEDGSPDVNAATGDVVRINPRFPDWRIYQEINNDLNDLTGRGLFQMKTHELTYTSQFDAFDLPLTDLLAEYAVRFEDPSTRRDWFYLNRPNWRVERNSNTTDFPSGLALHLLSARGGYFPVTGYTVQLLYKAPFTPFTAVTDDLADSGLPSTAFDLLELGAFVNLVAPRELKRNMGESQPNPRRQEEIPSGGVLRAYQGVAAQRERRIATELARLVQQWPVRGM